MRLTDLEIQNFRGIKEGMFEFSTDNQFICLIGSGDSTKSTLLLAVEWIFSKAWNLLVYDNDFYEGNTEHDIVLRGTFTEFPEAFLAEDKFGQYLRRPHVIYDGVKNDEPVDGEPLCLTIQFSVGSSLEPHWEIVCNRLEPKAISNIDRRKLPIGIVGDNCAKDMLWGRYSVLQKYADAKGILHDAYTTALRNAAENVDLKELDGFSSDVKRIGGTYGVGFHDDVKNKLLIQNGSFSASAGLYEGSVPLSLRGLGSQRLLSMGLNIEAYDTGTILLIDEIEHGLEPYRLRSLINQLREKSKTGVQVLITTHSPVVITECDISEIFVVQSKQGQTQLFPFFTDDNNVRARLQAQIRGDADAFLSKALIVCEGKTEIGFIKAIDEYLYNSRGCRLAYKGIGTALGGGENTFDYATVFKEHGYFISIFMDSDKESENAKKEEFHAAGISIFDWDSNNSIEEQLFLDSPKDVLQELINIAVDEKGGDAISQALKDMSIPFSIKDDEIVLTNISDEARHSLGQLAKKNHKNKKGYGGWFKRIDLGRKVGDKVLGHIMEYDAESKTAKTVSSIISWVENI